MATKKRKRFDEGGITEAADKAAGLKASEGDKVGFFERLRMGNIDDPSSEAYRRFGAGRGKAERTPVEDAVVTPVSRVDSGPGALNVEDEDKPSTNVYRVDSGPGKMSSGASKPAPVRKPAAPVSKPTKGSGPYRVDSGPGSMGMNYSNEGRGKAVLGTASVNQIPTDKATSVSGERTEPMSDTERNLTNMLAATGVVGGTAGAIYKGKKMFDAARKAVQEGAKKRAMLKRAAEEGIERNLADELRSYSTAAAEKAVAAKQRADKTLNPNAWLAGPKGMADNFKRGGKVKAKAPMKKMASGGSTSKASSRADGIAQRGKTRGKIY